MESCQNITANQEWENWALSYSKYSIAYKFDRTELIFDPDSFKDFNKAYDIETNRLTFDEIQQGYG